MAHYKIFVLFFVFSSFLSAQVYPDREIHSSLIKGIDLIIGQKYKKAEEEFAGLAKKYPAFPLWNVYYAAAKIAEAYDYGYDCNNDEIEYHLDEALKKSDKLLEQNSENIWYNYFRSLTKGYTAYYNGINESWYSAAKNGLSAINGFEDCIKKDSSFYDAYVGLGVFKYWKSRKSEFISWLPFFGNEKGAGINSLIRAKVHNSYNSYIAVYNLIWILIEEGKPKEASNLALDALKKYPDSRMFKWGYAKACESFAPDKAIEVYNEILISLQKDGVNNHYKEVILKYTMARIYKKNGDKKRALNLCDEILKIDIKDIRVKKKLEERIKKVIELKKELS